MESFNDARIGSFTGSEIHKLMVKGKLKDQYFGDGAITYINDKVNEWLNQKPKDSIENKWELEWGKNHEEEAVAWFEQMTGKKVQHFGVKNYKFFDYTDNSGASPDGLIVGEKAIIEIKCPANSSNHIIYLLQVGKTQPEQQAWLKLDVPKYYIQCQFEMMACKVDKCYFAAYDPRREDKRFKMAIIEVLPDAEMQKEIQERIERATELKQAIVRQLIAIPDLSNVKTKKELAEEELEAMASNPEFVDHTKLQH